MQVEGERQCSGCRGAFQLEKSEVATFGVLKARARGFSCTPRHVVVIEHLCLWKKKVKYHGVTPRELILTYPSLEVDDVNDGVGDDEWMFCETVRLGNLADASDLPMRKWHPVEKDGRRAKQSGCSI